MHASTLQGVLEHLRRWTDPARVRELRDADLLERFRLHREEAAFTLLVQRHGPMVLAVCRRVLGDVHAAEDAFQATFLVLIRNAAAIRKQRSLASWLHGVASRLAHKARKRTLRQRERVGQAFQPDIHDDPGDTLSARELRAALDEEIERLPAKYRTPLVLCYLADKTHEQAACELGWPKSSVTARLAKARQLLQQRLIRRGFTAPAGLLAALLTEQTANAALPTLLTLSTIRLAIQSLKGETIAAAATAILADAAVKGTAAAKWSAALMLLATIGFAAAVGLRLSGSGSPSKPEGPPPTAEAGGDRRAAKSEDRKPHVDRLGDPLPDGVLARIGSSRMRHGSGSVSTLTFTPDGKSLISGGGGALRIWDAATGKLRRRFDLDTDFWTLAFAFTADSIAVADIRLKTKLVTLRVFDLATGKVRRRVEMPERSAYAPLALSHDGKRLAYIPDKTTCLYDCNGQEVLRIPAGGNVVFAPDDKTLASFDFTDTVRIYDVANGKCVRELKHAGEDRLGRVSFAPDGRFLACIHYPKNEDDYSHASIWDLATGKEVHRLTGSSPGKLVLCTAFSPDSKFMAMGCQDHALILWDVATGKEVRRYPTDAFFASIAFSPDGKALAAASGEGTIRVWDVATGRVLPASADPLIDAINDLRFSTDGRRLIGRAAMPIAWDPTTGREVRRFFKAADYHPIALSPDESLLADADKEGTIHLREATTGKEVRVLKGHEKWIWPMIFSSDGRRLASGSDDGTIRVWDVASGRELHKLTGGGVRAMHLSFSPDGRWLASASDSPGPRGPYEVILWDLNRGREKTRFALTQDGEAIQMAFSPDSRLLAAVGGEGRRSQDPGEVKVWDVVSGQRRRSLDGHKTRAGSVAFSPDGRTLATGDASGTLLLWERATGRKRHQFIGHENWIYSVAFSPDGRVLASASYDAPVYLWDVSGAAEQPRRRLTERELRRCWTALAGDDAPTAFRAIRCLAAVPKQTMPFLREHLKAVPTPNLKRVRRLVERLDSNEFTERQEAAAELENQADAAASLLRQIMTKEKPSLEVRRRLQQILEAQETAPESLRAVRAVEVLEWIGTSGAVRLLDELANGAADARLTREASAAKRRLSR